MTKNRESVISIILPCRNEEGAIGQCLNELTALNWEKGQTVEVIVVNNDSNDKSAEIIDDFSTKYPYIRSVYESEIGYGIACKRGFAEAKGEILLLCDSDMTHDFKEFKLFIDKINEGCDLVIGNRFNKRMIDGSMNVLRKTGNIIFSFFAKHLFKLPISDIHCGMRAITKEAFLRLPLKTGGMEFASEMVIKAKRRNMKISEVSVSYKPRVGESKLEALRDGWRHLRFYLLFSPLATFFVPSILMLVIGFITGSIYYFSGFDLISNANKIYLLLISSILIIVGYQLLFFSAFSKIYAITHLGEKNEKMQNLFKYITIEKAGFVGILVVFIGIIFLIYNINIESGGNLGKISEFNDSILALTAIVIGTQTFFSAFMLSILGIKED